VSLTDGSPELAPAQGGVTLAPARGELAADFTDLGTVGLEKPPSRCEFSSTFYATPSHPPSSNGDASRC
jgi:hypothetical protein